jgi:hypothetical protein
LSEYGKYNIQICRFHLLKPVNDHLKKASNVEFSKINGIVREMCLARDEFSFQHYISLSEKASSAGFFNYFKK